MIEKELKTGKVEGQWRWYINRQGQTMVLVPQPSVFCMGKGEERHQRQVNRSFAIAGKEVTVRHEVGGELSSADRVSTADRGGMGVCLSSGGGYGVFLRRT